MLTVEEFAERWAVDVKTVYEAIKENQIPAVRIGKRVLRIPRAWIEEKEQGRDMPEGGK